MFKCLFLPPLLHPLETLTSYQAPTDTEPLLRPRAAQLHHEAVPGEGEKQFCSPKGWMEQHVGRGPKAVQSPFPTAPSCSWVPAHTHNAAPAGNHSVFGLNEAVSTWLVSIQRPQHLVSIQQASSNRSIIEVIESCD